jgi:type I restriction enzyme S subunit
LTKKADQERGVFPKLRFPEFATSGVWAKTPLKNISVPIQEKVGSAKITPVSITAGYGFVSQISKFGRDISGDQYKNYTYLKRGDFAYNKGNSKKFPQGYICQLNEFEEAAASTAFICFRLKGGYEPRFLQAFFDQNVHGRQLAKYITSGARSDGLLNIRPEDFYNVEVAIPPKHEEQQKVAECLSSLDALIVAEAEELDALKSHKKGLMQKLFPHEGETSPRVRFPEFRNSPEWITEPLGQVFDTATGGTPDRKKSSFWGGEVPWITTSLVDFNIIASADEFISSDGLKYSSAKIFPKNTVLIAMYGQGKTRGKVALLGIEAATNQACAAILPRKDIDPVYVFLNLASRYEEIRSLSNSGGQENLSQGLIGILPFSFPADIKEQRRIAACLSSVDTLVIAQSDKLKTLTKFRKGLMQQLIPSSNGAST